MTPRRARRRSQGPATHTESVHSATSVARWVLLRASTLQLVGNQAVSQLVESVRVALSHVLVQSEIERCSLLARRGSQGSEQTRTRGVSLSCARTIALNGPSRALCGAQTTLTEPRAECLPEQRRFRAPKRRRDKVRIAKRRWKMASR